jgi:F0F1-type ATP synthase assembly protein I
MIRRPINIVRRFTHSHKPNSQIDCASWHKSEEFKAKIDNMSNKIDHIHSTMDMASGILGGCIIGAGIGLSIPVFIEVFKHFF